MSTPLVFLAAALLVGPPAPQDPPPIPIRDPNAPRQPIADPAEPEWVLFNRVEVIVNEDIITRRDLIGDLRYYQAQGRLTTEAAYMEAEQEVFENRIRELLMIEAGQDLGLPEEQLRLNIDSVMDREVENAGGVTALAESLKRTNTDSSTRRERWAEQLYSYTWRGIVTGEQPGPAGRPVEDRYVRPGLRLFEHRAVVETPPRYSYFGGVSPAVTFQLLIVPYETSGGRGAAREYAEEIRDSAVEGEDFDALVTRYGALKGDEARITAGVERLRALEPELAGWAEDATPGEISPVLTAHLLSEAGRRIPAWGIGRMAERIEPVPPDFDDRETQRRLEEYIETILDNGRVEEALIRLYRSAFVWPPEFANE